MRIEKILKIILATSPLLFVLGFVPISPDLFGFCSSSRFDCFRAFSSYKNIGAFVVFLAIFLFLMSGIIFVRIKSKKIFHSWLKFAIPYLVLATILISISPSSNAGIYGLDSELIAWFTSGLFLIISLLIISIKSWKLRKASNL